MLRSTRSLAARQREMRERQPAPCGPGRPPLPIHSNEVYFLARRGYSLVEIAGQLRCCPNTLRARFQPEFQDGQAWFSGAEIVD